MNVVILLSGLNLSKSISETIWKKHNI